MNHLRTWWHKAPIYYYLSQFCRLTVPSWAVLTWSLTGGCRHTKAAVMWKLDQVGCPRWLTDVYVGWVLSWGCQPLCLFMAFSRSFSSSQYGGWFPRGSILKNSVLAETVKFFMTHFQKPHGITGQKQIAEPTQIQDVNTRRCNSVGGSSLKTRCHTVEGF